MRKERRKRKCEEHPNKEREAKHRKANAACPQTCESQKPGLMEEVSYHSLWGHGMAGTKGGAR